MSYGSKYALQPLSNMTLVCTYRHNLKITGCMLTLYIVNDCSTIENVFFSVRAAGEIGLARYVSKPSSQFISDKPFMHLYTHNLKVQDIYMYGR